MTNKLTTLQALRDRVANATGLMTGGEATDIANALHPVAIPGKRPDQSDAFRFLQEALACSSIDAALAWVERVLPGWETCNASQGRLLGGTASYWFWELWNPEYEADDGASGCCGRLAPTPALAIILAGLDALIAKEKTDDQA